MGYGFEWPSFRQASAEVTLSICEGAEKRQSTQFTEFNALSADEDSRGSRMSLGKEAASHGEDGGHLTLVDLQPEMLEKARRKLDRAGCDNVSFEVVDVSTELPFPDGSFDIAFLVAVLGEVFDKQACAGSLYRALRPGGRLAVLEHFPDPDRLSVAELRKILEPAGFQLVATTGRSRAFTAHFRRP